MKCTQCGKSQFIKTEFPILYGGSDVSVSLSSDVDVYLCESCGHYEMFSMRKVKLHKNIVKCLDGFENKIEELNSDIKKIDEYIADTKMRIKNIEAQIEKMDVDITIRKQQQLQQRIEELRNAINQSEDEKYQIDKKVSEVKSNIKQVQDVQKRMPQSSIESEVYRYAYKYDGYGRRIKRNDFMARIFDGLDDNEEN